MFCFFSFFILLQNIWPLFLHIYLTLESSWRCQKIISILSTFLTIRRLKCLSSSILLKRQDKFTSSHPVLLTSSLSLLGLSFPSVRFLFLFPEDMTRKNNMKIELPVDWEKMRFPVQTVSPREGKEAKNDGKSKISTIREVEKRLLDIQDSKEREKDVSPKRQHRTQHVNVNVPCLVHKATRIAIMYSFSLSFPFWICFSLCKSTPH